MGRRVGSSRNHHVYVVLAIVLLLKLVVVANGHMEKRMSGELGDDGVEDDEGDDEDDDDNDADDDQDGNNHEYDDDDDNDEDEDEYEYYEDDDEDIDWTPIDKVESSYDLYRLKQRLLYSYDKGARPVLDSSQPIKVFFRVRFVQINNLDEVFQVLLYLKILVIFKFPNTLI